MKSKRLIIRKKALLILAAVLLLLLIAPIIYCGRFAVMAADDYSYGAKIHQSAVSGASGLAVLKAALYTVCETYATWQGTFSGIFLMGMSPAALFGDGYYALTPLIMLLALIVGVYILSREVYCGLFGIGKSTSALISIYALILCTQLLPDARESFYWYNGAVYYTFMFGVSLAVYGCGVKYARIGGGLRLAVLCLGAVFLGGGNYVTALTSSVLACGAVAFLALRRNRRWKLFLFPTLLLLCSFAASIAAPGNLVRQSATGIEHCGVMEAVLNSFKAGAVKCVQWFSLAVLGGLLAVSPLLWGSARRSSHSFRFPLLVTGFSYCLLSAMFCPHLYALDSLGAGRLQNIIFFSYILLLIFNMFYWLGWVNKKYSRSAAGEQDSVPVAAKALSLALAGVCCAAYILSGNSLTSVVALNLARSEEAVIYLEATQERQALLNDSSLKDVLLKPYPTGPIFVYDDDISYDPDYWINRDMSSYYGKDSVALDSAYY